MNSESRALSWLLGPQPPPVCAVNLQEVSGPFKYFPSRLCSLEPCICKDPFRKGKGEGLMPSGTNVPRDLNPAFRGFAP